MAPLAVAIPEVAPLAVAFPVVPLAVAPLAADPLVVAFPAVPLVVAIPVVAPLVAAVLAVAPLAAAIPVVVDTAADPRAKSSVPSAPGLASMVMKKETRRPPPWLRKCLISSGTGPSRPTPDGEDEAHMAEDKKQPLSMKIDNPCI